MSPVLLSVALLATGLGFVLAAVRLRRDDPALQLVAELEGEAVTTGDAYGDRLREPLLRRLGAPLAARLQAGVTDLAPSSLLERLRTDLVRAGLTARFTAEEFVVLRVGAAAAGVVVLVLFLLVRPDVQGLAVGVLAVVVGVLAPPALLSRAREARVATIEQELSDAIDLLAISVEAGLGFEQALAVVVDSRPTTVGAEFGHTLREIQLGRSRAEALHELDRRVDVGDLSSLVLSLVQADALGMPLTRVLRTQAAELRRRRRQRVREAAARLPVKILVPMVLFILPALLAIVLGPALLSLAGTLG